MGINYRFQEGKVIVIHNKFLGYTKDDKGELVIVPEEAEIVRRILKEFLEGKSPYKIAAGLVAICRKVHRALWLQKGTADRIDWCNHRSLVGMGNANRSPDNNSFGSICGRYLHCRTYSYQYHWYLW